jgi:hypothetical protein
MVIVYFIEKLCEGSSTDLETLVYKSQRHLQAGSKHREPNGPAVAFLISNAVRRQTAKAPETDLLLILMSMNA